MAWKKRGTATWKGENKPKTTVKRVVKGKANLVVGSLQQEAIWKEFVNPKGMHIIVQALAGTGKTFTVIEGLRRLIESGFNRRIAFIAFNASIAAELKKKVPLGVEAATCHSICFRAYRSFDNGCIVNDDKTFVLMAELVGGDQELKQMMRNDPTIFPNVRKLVGLAKATLLGYSDESGFDADSIDDFEFIELADKYGLDLNGSAKEVCEYARDILDMASDKDQSNGLIDYDDMIWLPVIHNVRMPVYQVLCVDEAQDLNRCQQEAILRMGVRIVLVGDPNQSIYGFRGADIQSMARMATFLEGTERKLKVMPLTVTRRCPKLHVELAKTIVPDFEAMPEAPLGVINTLTEEKALESMEAGDLVVCRANAPIVSAAFRLLRMGRKANIQGRDLGQGLLALIRKLLGRNENESVDILLDKLEIYEMREMKKINERSKGNPDKLLSLQDKCDCIRALCDDVEMVNDVKNRISNMFLDMVTSDDKPRNFVLLSSVHRAKGLEARKVFVYHPEKMPHPMARGPEGLQQEMNIKYVAFTRSLDTLIMVPESKR